MNNDLHYYPHENSDTLRAKDRAAKEAAAAAKSNLTRSFSDYDSQSVVGYGHQQPQQQWAPERVKNWVRQTEPQHQHGFCSSSVNLRSRFSPRSSGSHQHSKSSERIQQQPMSFQQAEAQITVLFK